MLKNEEDITRVNKEL